MGRFIPTARVKAVNTVCILNQNAHILDQKQIVGCRLLRLLCDLGDSTILNHFLFYFFLDGVLSEFIFCLLFILLLYLYIYIYLRFIDFSFWHYCHAILLSLSF